MSNEQNLELSETIAKAFDAPCRSMIDQNIEPRAIVMALLLQGFDLLLDEAAGHADTRKVFLAIADAATRIRLDSLKVPNINDE